VIVTLSLAGPYPASSNWSLTYLTPVIPKTRASVPLGETVEHPGEVLMLVLVFEYQSAAPGPPAKFGTTPPVALISHFQWPEGSNFL
jgi:hypothetical protein